LRRRADRERRHLVEKEIQAVIIVEHHDDVGFGGLEPVPGRREAIKKRLPIRLPLQVLRDSTADGRDV